MGCRAMSRINVRSALLVVGAVLIVGGIVEALDILHRAWSFPSWTFRTLCLSLLEGPTVHIGLGLVLWRLTDR